MKFYKLTDIFNNDDIYVNPNHLEMYEYVDKSDFVNMMILEGAREY